MRHHRSGRKLGRDASHRKALYANLTSALIEHGRIKTTTAKAKEVRPIAEQMITLGRRGGIHARRHALAFLRSQDVVHKLFSDVGPRFVDRPGGYSRIIKIGPRAGDAAEMAYLELVDYVAPGASPGPVRPARAPRSSPAPAQVQATPAAAVEPEGAAEIESAVAEAEETPTGDEAVAVEQPTDEAPSGAADMTEVGEPAAAVEPPADEPPMEEAGSEPPAAVEPPADEPPPEGAVSEAPAAGEPPPEAQPPDAG